MKNFFVWISFIALSLFLTSCTLTIFIPHFTEDTTYISVRVGEYFIIRLEENPSTGCVWEGPFILDTNIVSFIDVVRNSQSKSIEIVGAPVDVEWEFKAIAPGYTTITFRYKRPWETAPIEIKTFSVYVR